MPGYHRLVLPEAYRAMLDLEPSGFAWEWLRRNPDFRALWSGAGLAAWRASATSRTAGRRKTTTITEIARHPLAGGMGPWGLTFAPAPDTPATGHPLIGWLPQVRLDTLTLIRPISWAQPVADLRFEPEHWGPGVFRIPAPGGAHLLVRRHGAAELALWLPDGLAPVPGAAFGLYVHADRHIADRARLASRLRRALGHRPPLRHPRFASVERQAAMLCVHDLSVSGMRLRDIAGMLLGQWPGDWRSSSERSDLRRLAEAGAAMVAGGYRQLLHPRRAPFKLEA